MGQAFGIVTAAVQLGVEAILVKPKRAIGPFSAHVTIEEVHTDELEITDQPVEMGAPVTDHSFRRPSEIIITACWSNSPQRVGLISGLLGAVQGTVGGITSIITGNNVDQVRDVYQKLLALQASRERFDVYTGKRAYKNMMMKTLIVRTDKEHENSLFVTATLREVLIAQTQSVTISAPAEQQSIPEQTMPSVNKGMKQLGDGTRMNLGAAIDALTPSLSDVTGSVLP